MGDLEQLAKAIVEEWSMKFRVTWPDPLSAVGLADIIEKHLRSVCADGWDAATTIFASTPLDAAVKMGRNNAAALRGKDRSAADYYDQMSDAIDRHPIGLPKSRR